VSLRSKMLALAAIPVVVLMITVVLAVFAQSEAADANAEVDRTGSITFVLAGMEADLADAEADLRGYLVSGRETFLSRYESSVAEVNSDLRELDPLVRDSVQLQRLERVHELIEERVTTLQEIRRLGDAQTVEEQARLDTWLLHGQTISDALRGLITQMQISGRDIATAKVRERDAAFERTYLVEVIAMPVAFAVSILLLIGFAAGMVRRISVIRNNARRLDDGVPMQDPDPSRDELGTLSRALTRAGKHMVELQDELRQLATIDQLTGLANRRGFFAVAEHQLLVAARTRSSVALMFIDTDGLKQVNDESGHSVGDAYLVEAADIIRETIRASDLAGRLGGDEFCVLLLGEPDLDADRVVQRMRDTVAHHNALPGRRFDVSLSIGLSTLAPGRAVTLEELIDAADEGMYEDKRAKRNPQQVSTA
jgi:diguanylate cyclase (GGDEF)-like protein